MITKLEGPKLDELLAAFGLSRRTGETDDDLKARMVAEGFAQPMAYIGELAPGIPAHIDGAESVHTIATILRSRDRWGSRQALIQALVSRMLDIRIGLQWLHIEDEDMGRFTAPQVSAETIFKHLISEGIVTTTSARKVTINHKALDLWEVSRVLILE